MGKKLGKKLWGVPTNGPWSLEVPYRFAQAGCLRQQRVMVRLIREAARIKIVWTLPLFVVPCQAAVHQFLLLHDG